MTQPITSNQSPTAEWPAPTVPAAAHERKPTGTAAILVGVIGSIVGALTFIVVWLASNVTLNSCRYTGSDSTVDVAQARLWLSLATLFWVTAPLIAGLLARRASRNVPVWYVLAATYALVGIWAVAMLGPWELCM